MTVNEIVSGISQAIYNEFGDDYEIYTEAIEQGLTEPCFSIVVSEIGSDMFNASRFLRKSSFCIHYFPSTDEPKNEFYEVCEKLYDCLLYIDITENNDDETITSSIMGTAMTAEYVDGVGHFFVDYDMYVNKDTEDETAMEIYESNTNIKEEE